MHHIYGLIYGCWDRHNVLPVVDERIEQVISFKDVREVIDLNDMGELILVEPDSCVTGIIITGILNDNILLFKDGFDLTRPQKKNNS